jgi:hypothetical protein
MATIIKQKVRTKSKVLTLTERGLMSYLLGNADADGLVQQSVRTISRATDNTPKSNVQRARQGLIDKGYVEEVTPSKNRGRGGDDTAPVLRPHRHRGTAFVQTVGQDQVTDSTESKLSHTQEKPIDVGQITDICTSVSLQSADSVNSDRPIDVLPDVYVGVGQVQPPSAPHQPAEPYRSGQRGITAFDPRRLPICSECHLDNCDYFEHDGVVDIERFCSEDCDEAWSEAQAIAEAETRKEKL